MTTWIVGTLIVMAVVFLIGALVIYVLVRAWILRMAARIAVEVEGRTSQLIDAAVARGDTAIALSSKVQLFAQSKGIPVAEARAGFFRHTQALADCMDSAVVLPLIGPVGLNGLLALVPFIGNGLCAIVSAAVVINAIQFGLPQNLVSRMLANVFTQLLLGIIPFLGAIAIVEYRANTRNMRLLRDHLDQKRASLAAPGIAAS